MCYMKDNPMKRLFSLLLFVPCLISLGRETLPSDYNCFTVLVGKNASVDGTVLYGHNDDDGFQLVNTYVEPRKNYAQGAEQTLQYGGRIPQVPTTHKFLWLEVPGMEVADGFMNEYGVCIGSNFCGSREDRLDISHGGILYDLRLIMAQRAKTAREAVRIAGRLIEEFGYRGSGRSYCISDREEAWVLAAVKGKRWAAARVPDDEVMVLPITIPLQRWICRTPPTTWARQTSSHMLNAGDGMPPAKTANSTSETHTHPMVHSKTEATQEEPGQHTAPWKRTTREMTASPSLSNPERK